MIIVSGTDMYHFIPPTRLFAKPITPKKKIETHIVAINTACYTVLVPPALAMTVGKIGIKPKRAKLKKVTILLVIGFYYPAIS